MTPTQRAAMEQALEALENISQKSISREHAQLMSKDAITALRAALAEQPAEQEQEPVAWAKDTGKKLRITPMDMRGDGGWRPLGYIDTTPQPTIPPGYKLVNSGALRMVVNALRRDAAEGKTVRAEMADALIAAYDAKNGITGETQ